jgi:hypothetical protein
MPDQPENTKRQLPENAETRGVVDQVIAPSVIAFSGGLGVGAGKPIAEAIVAKVTKPKDPPADK